MRISVIARTMKIATVPQASDCRMLTTRWTEAARTNGTFGSGSGSGSGNGTNAGTGLAGRRVCAGRNSQSVSIVRQGREPFLTQVWADEGELGGRRQSECAHASPVGRARRILEAWT